MATALLHVLALILLLSPMLETRSGARPQPQMQAMLVSLLPEQPLAPVTPPSPVEPPRELRPVVPVPAPVAVPKPVARPVPARHAARPMTSATRTVSPSTQVANEDEEVEDVVGRIRDNWLEPPGITVAFNCRLRLDYAAGGMITAVHFLQGCTGRALADSVKRAIWKTRLLDGKRDAGSLEIDFTP